MSRISFIITLLIIITSAGCGLAGEPRSVLEVGQAWIRAVGAIQGQDSAISTPNPMSGHGAATPAASGMHSNGMNSAAYMVIENKGTKGDRLLRVEGNVADAIEIHMTDVQNDIMTMRPVESVEIPAGGQVSFEPGGLHIMLINLREPLTAGNRVKLTLVFESSDPIAVEAEVRAP